MESAETSRRNAYEAFKAGRYDRAVALLSASLAADPRDAQTWNFRGGIRFYFLGDMQGALADFDKAIELAPEFALPYTNRGWIRLLSGHDKDAMTDFSTHVRLESDSPFAHFKVGVVYFCRGEYEAASDSFSPKRPGDGFNYVKLWRFIAESARGVEATDELLAGLAREESELVKSTGLMLAGKLPMEEYWSLPCLASGGGQTPSETERPHGHLYTGLKLLVMDKDQVRAREHLERCVSEAPASMSMEPILAKTLLALPGDRDGQPAHAPD